MRLKDLDRFDKVELEPLLSECKGPCVSLFLPTAAVSGRELQAAALLLRNLLNQATDQLTAQGLTPAAIEQLLAPVSAVAEPNQTFWGEQHNGLAIFAASADCIAYRLPLSLPVLAVVDQHFYIRPLLPLIDGDENFYVLALSQNSVRLLHGTRYQMTEVDLTDTPTSLGEALRYDEFERSLQLHTAGSMTGSSRAPVIFHGQGVAGDETITHTSLLRFFHSIERTVTSRLNRTHAPLLLAGVAADQGLYRQVNHYPHLLERGIPGNYDKAPTHALHDAAWTIVAPYFLGARNRALTRYQQLAGQGDGHTMTEIKNVVLAAVYHQVDTIFTPPNIQLWGRFIPEGHQVVIHKEAEPGDEELINLAVVHTLKNNGAAYLVGPEASTVAAILRH